MEVIILNLAVRCIVFWIRIHHCWLVGDSPMLPGNYNRYFCFNLQSCIVLPRLATFAHLFGPNIIHQAKSRAACTNCNRFRTLLQQIGWHILQEQGDFPWNMGVSCKFSLKAIHWLPLSRARGYSRDMRSATACTGCHTWMVVDLATPYLRSWRLRANLGNANIEVICHPWVVWMLWE